MAERTKYYFLSDAHLGARYVADPRAHEERVVAMLRMMERDARAIYMLGDMVDFWFAYRHVVPKGFSRFFGEVARLTDAGIPVYWFKGNHDMWTRGYLESELGVRVVDTMLEQELDGRVFVMSHGDGMGPIPASFRALRSFFRNEGARRIGAALHPRWLMGFGLWWSGHNRVKRVNAPQEYLGDTKEHQMQFAIDYARKHPEVDYFVMGHRHIVADCPVPGSQARYICIGDCLNRFTYGVFDGKNMRIEQFESGNL